MSFVVEHIKRRGPVKPSLSDTAKRALAKAATPLPLSDVIGRLRAIADKASTLQGVSRNNPHQFAEDKSELVQAANRLHDDVRSRGIAPNA